MKQSKWIKVEEGKPNICEKVLLWTKNIHQPLWDEYGFGHYENEKFYLVGGYDRNDRKITHWQPLPIPPVINSDCKHGFHHVEEISAVVCTDCGEVIGRQSDC